MKKLLLALVFLGLMGTLRAERRIKLLNDNWSFRFSWQVQKGSERRVDLPHTWNAQDALAGRPDYFRGMGNYRKNLFVDHSLKGKRLFLRFEGANTVTNLFVNQKRVGEHRGGYGAFVFDITEFVEYGADNELLVRVDNALQLDVMPLVGDFNFYGGIYRDVYLVVTDPQHISLTDYASPGVYLVQEQVTKEQATIKTRVMVSNYGAACRSLLAVQIFDGDRPLVRQEKEIDLATGVNQPYELELTIPRPHLWNGRKDPFCYRAEVTLQTDGRARDRVEQPLGLRFYSVDAERGFFLNGEPLKLKGVCRHQDRAEVGNALRNVHHEEDMSIILEMGTNAMRLAHYPQASFFYELADRNGLVVWAEIPFIGPGGYEERGFVDLPAFKANGKEQLKELIRQHYNHPSICFWGLFNELKTIGDSPEAYIRELNALAHREDPTRLTTAASFLEDGSPLSRITDVIAWNKYFGWYGGRFSDMGAWADVAHQHFPHYKIGISEYGAGASVYHQQDTVKAGEASGWWHPENWQTAYHMGNWKAIAERPFIWGSFIWNLFDFGAAHRTEGDRPGINDKGLVTFDRKIKKDAFYFYKANWNRTDKFVYLAGRRNVNRQSLLTDIQVFTNLPEAEIWINGRSWGKRKADEYAVCVWEKVELRPGENTVEVRASDKKSVYTDRVVWNAAGRLPLK